MDLLSRTVSFKTATRVRRVLMPYFSNFQRKLLVFHSTKTFPDFYK